jgi:hypothetical protein
LARAGSPLEGQGRSSHGAGRRRLQSISAVAGGEGSGERVLERVGSAGIRFGVHWGQETHRGVVLHCGGQRPEGNDVESIVQWRWRLARGSERRVEHRRCSWWRWRGDSMAGGAGRCGSALGGDGGMQESRGGERGREEAKQRCFSVTVAARVRAHSAVAACAARGGGVAGGRPHRREVAGSDHTRGYGPTCATGKRAPSLILFPKFQNQHKLCNSIW